MPAGASPKREREYKKLEQRFKKEHRYPGREEEVASRIVNKQRSQYAETEGAQQRKRAGRAPDRKLPVPDYEHLTIAQADSKLRGLSAAQIRKLRDYEAGHKNRKGMLARLDRMLRRH